LALQNGVELPKRKEVTFYVWKHNLNFLLTSQSYVPKEHGLSRFYFSNLAVVTGGVRLAKPAGRKDISAGNLWVFELACRHFD
jgi:hypothetical protein